VRGIIILFPSHNGNAKFVGIRVSVTSSRKIILVVGSYLSFVALGFFTERSNFIQLIALFAFAFAGYFYFVKIKEAFTVKEIIWIALLFRVSMLAMTPNLSDDYWRFIWDGRLSISGHNPFEFLPENHVDNPLISELDLNGEVYEGLNSKSYYTIYPPINQAIFALTAALGFRDVATEILLLRFLLIAFEMATILFMIKLLKALKKPPQQVILYALNPLVIVEISGNLHFEGTVVFFLCLAGWFVYRQKWTISAMAFAGAVLSKMFPLLLLPLLIRRMGWWKSVLYGLIVLVVSVAAFVPFMSSGGIQNLWSSIDLYFQRFEFNASVYYLVREAGRMLSGHNLIHSIGPALSVLTVGLILGVVFWKKLDHLNLAAKAVLMLTIYYLMATTVHPWYIITMVGLAVFSGQIYPLIWSFLVVLSYSHYWGGGFQECYWIIGVEYLFLAASVVWGKHLFNGPSNAVS
jgi:alpha-1,6-mannosyltransferase